MDSRSVRDTSNRRRENSRFSRNNGRKGEMLPRQRRCYEEQTETGSSQNGQKKKMKKKGGAYSGDRSCKSCLDDSMKWIEDPPSVVVVVSVGAYLVSYREYFVYQVL